MLSHRIKKLLDEATGQSFSPVIGMSESFPICSYKLSDVEDEVLKLSRLEVRIQGDDFDQLEELREQIKGAISIGTNEKSLSVDGYVIRSKVAGGGILSIEGEMFDSTQYFMLTWYRKGV